MISCFVSNIVTFYFQINQQWWDIAFEAQTRNDALISSYFFRCESFRYQIASLILSFCKQLRERNFHKMMSTITCFQNARWSFSRRISHEVAACIYISSSQSTWYVRCYYCTSQYTLICSISKIHCFFLIDASHKISTRTSIMLLFTKLKLSLKVFSTAD